MTTERARVVFLDDNDDLRQLMPELLESTLGVECMAFASVQDFENHPKEVLLAKVAILDINLGPNTPDGIDAFNWLKQRGFRGKILFFTGHARANPQLALAEKDGAQILEKPVHPDVLVSAVRFALSEAA
jgi:FixJ family two-component response regulator